jgi:hypothetical protein
MLPLRGTPHVPVHRNPRTVTSSGLAGPNISTTTLSRSTSSGSARTRSRPDSLPRLVDLDLLTGAQDPVDQLLGMAAGGTVRTDLVHTSAPVVRDRPPR